MVVPLPWPCRYKIKSTPPLAEKLGGRNTPVSPGDGEPAPTLMAKYSVTSFGGRSEKVNFGMCTLCSRRWDNGAVILRPGHGWSSHGFLDWGKQPRRRAKEAG